MSLPPGKELALLAPEHQVRSVLLALLDDPVVRHRALNHYHTLKAADNPATGLKRKAMNDLFVCVQCDQAFTQEDNTETSCRYHPGDLDVDDEEDFWADHDEDCHGEINTVEMREEMPDGFRWSCCRKLGGRKGCTKGKHEADSAKSNRGGHVPSGSEMRKNAGSHFDVLEDSEGEE
ncbi:hypothetical protein F53441_13331 [Fusarium austroafricanum]|uniref:C2H2-type domain-containing protein n=1 Tax=Fusarium austroafricanum TaxID=2364996 RepID=A0A8H4NK68_9HYPO|nr:hypothetical protein F53441_13331 [Fusarium austroafricanum]